MNEKEVKRLSSLHVKKYREKYQQFLIEGSRLTYEALLADADVVTLFSVSGVDENISQATSARNIPIETIQEKQLRQISDTVSPSGIIGVCAIPENDLSSIPKTDNCIFLDSISDPGNLGTIARTAAWFGVHHIVLSEKCADPYNPKVVRAGMGAHFYCNFYMQTPSSWLAQSGKEMLVADANTDANGNIGSFPNPWILVMGSEAEGISEEIHAISHTKVSIPKLGKGESLNVAVAAGIILSSITDGKM